MLLTYLNTLKNKGNFTFEQIANLSGVPEATIKNIFSGKTEAPRFDTISSIVLSMGGSLDEVYSNEKKADIEANTIILLKETYEKRIEELKAYYKDHIETVKSNTHMARVIACVLGGILLVFLFADVLFSSVGWIRY